MLDRLLSQEQIPHKTKIAALKRGSHLAQRVTIKTIAQELGISHMTVSRALSNHPNVHAETRQEILKRAAELGYVKSAVATAMRGDGTGIIGLLLPNIVNEFYARFANALAAACDSSALSLMIHLTDDNPDQERQSILRLREVQADSVIMVPAPRTDGDEPLHLDSFNVLQFIRTRPEEKPLSTLTIEDSTAIEASVDHLASKGHKDIAYIGASESLSSGRARLAAFTRAVSRNGLAAKADLIHTGAPSFLLGHQSLLSILKQKERATALVCGGFEISSGALDACLRQGLSMPDEMAFVGYGDPSFYEWINGGISTISLPVESLALQSLDMVKSVKPNGEGNAESLSQAAALIVRKST